MWDVVVVGGGPAGSAAAMALLKARPEAAVLVVDRARFPRDKACGDGIAPHAVDVLRGLGVPWTFPTYRPVSSLVLSTRTQRVARDMARPAWVVPRHTFDDHLLRHAQSMGAQVARHRVRRAASTANSVVLDDTIEARVVIAADGAHSDVRRACGHGVGRRAPDALAIRGYAPTPDARRGQQVIAFSDIRQPSYAWSFDRGDGWSNVGYGEVVGGGRGRQGLSKALMLEQCERLLPDATHAGHRWRAAPLPLSGRGFGHPGGRVLYVGDAARLVNPLTGEGIYYAVLTGLLAARAALGASRRDPGDSYRRSVVHHLRPHLATTATLRRATRSSSLVNLGLRAAAKDQATFDDLVEIGLGRGTVTRHALWALGRSTLPWRN